MTKEDKQLLLKDLCARLPYRVKYETEYGPRIINDLFIYSNGPVYTDHEVGDYNEIYGVELINIKPYLRPMISMTEEEAKEVCRLENFENHIIGVIPNNHTYHFTVGDAVIDWLNEHHFDYRGLIEKGLALEAPKGMYKED